MLENDIIKTLQASIVIAGNGLSSSGYGGATLFEKEIIPDDWNWKVSKTQEIPSLFFETAYDDGRFFFRAEPGKITFGRNTLGDENPFEDGKLIRFVVNFLEHFKHITISGYGVNFVGVIVAEDSKSKVNGLLVAQEKLDNIELETIGLTFVYNMSKPTARLRLVINQGEAKSNLHPDPFKGIAFDANFHRDLLASSATSQIVEKINLASRDFEVLNGILKSIFKL